MGSRAACVGVLLLVAGGAAAQGESPADAYAPALWRHARLEDDSTLAHLGAGRVAAELEIEREVLESVLAVEPYPIRRETLEGEGESLHRHASLPGGIVLGLEATVPAELAGARLARDAAGTLGLELGPGAGFVRVPALSSQTLRACARFVRDGLDGVIDLWAPAVAPRLAPAFQGSELAELLVRMDHVPHTVLPDTRAWKTLIVDRAARLELRGGELVLAADLEVRCYDQAGGWARRVRSIDAPAADFVGPRASADRGGELAPLAEIAAWLGFLRWAARADPRGFAALCGE